MMISSCGTSTTEISSKDSPLLPETTLSETTEEGTTESVFSEDSVIESVEDSPSIDSQTSEESTTSSQEIPPTPNDNLHDNYDFSMVYREKYGGFACLGYFGDKEEITIPTMHRSMPVTAIELRSHFSFGKIKTLHIPSSVQFWSPDIYSSRFTNLEWIDVEQGNPFFCSNNGILYDKEMKTMICYPSSHPDKIVNIPSTVVDLSYCKFVIIEKECEAYNVEEGNSSFSSKEGVLYNKDQTQLIRYPCLKTDKEFVVPKQVEEIGYQAFCNSKLENIALPENVVIEGRAFESCKNLRKIVIPEGVKKLGSSFSYCDNLEELVLPNSLEEFSASICPKLLSITLPRNVKNFFADDYRFDYGLEDVFVDELNPYFSSIDGCVYTKDKKELCYIPSLKKGIITLPKEMEKIPESSFYKNCLSGLVVEEGNTNFHSYEGVVYKNDIGTAMILPGGKEEIRIKNGISHHLYENTCVKKFYFEESVKFFYAGVELYLALEEIVVDPNNPYFSFYEGGLYNKDQTILLYLMSNVVEGKVAPTTKEVRIYGGCYSLKSIQISDSTEICSLHNCDELEQVQLGDNCSSFSFLSCPKLREITVSLDNVYFSSEELFVYNKDKTELVWVSPTLTGVCEIKNPIKVIRSGAFSRCDGITDIILPDTLEEIKNECFLYCSNLENVIIPDSVTKLGKELFYGSFVRNIYIGSGITELPFGIFSNNDCNTNFFFANQKENMVINPRWIGCFEGIYVGAIYQIAFGVHY